MIKDHKLVLSGGSCHLRRACFKICQGVILIGCVVKTQRHRNACREGRRFCTHGSLETRGVRGGALRGSCRVRGAEGGGGAVGGSLYRDFHGKGQAGQCQQARDGRV